MSELIDNSKRKFLPECARGAENYRENGNTQTMARRTATNQSRRAGYSKPFTTGASHSERRSQSRVQAAWDISPRSSPPGWEPM